MRVICSGPQQDLDTEQEGQGEWQRGAETENEDRMSRSQGRSGEAEKQKGFCSPVSGPRKERLSAPRPPPQVGHFHSFLENRRLCLSCCWAFSSLAT